MEDGVKFIFKTLLKVPIFIYVTFFIFNIFAFCFCYFKILGVSYILQQSIIENNYISHNELVGIGEYIEDMSGQIAMMPEVNVATFANDGAYEMWLETSDTGSLLDIGSGATVLMYSCDGVDGPEYLDLPSVTENRNNTRADFKKQYGCESYIGIQCIYDWVWPFDYRNSKYTSPNIAHGQYQGARIGNVVLGGWDADEYHGTGQEWTVTTERQKVVKPKSSVMADGTEADTSITEELTLSKNYITIITKVPGMKYYADLC